MSSKADQLEPKFNEHILLILTDEPLIVIELLG